MNWAAACLWRPFFVRNLTNCSRKCDLRHSRDTDYQRVTKMQDVWGTQLSVTIDQHLGAKITQAREKLGLDQSDLAEKIEIPLQRLSEFERGTVRIPAESIARLSRALGVTPGWFYTGLPGQDAFDRVG